MRSDKYCECDFRPLRQRQEWNLTPMSLPVRLSRCARRHVSGVFPSCSARKHAVYGVNDEMQRSLTFVVWPQLAMRKRISGFSGRLGPIFHPWC